MTRRQRRIFFTWFWRVAILLVIMLLVAINGNQQSMMIMQTDAMDKLNEISVEVVPEEEVIDTSQENCSQVNSESLTPEERELVCRVVMSEARGEDLQAQMAVAQTILDRSRDWSMTITDVVIQTGAYDCSYQGGISDSVRLAVADVFDGGVRVFEGGTYQFHDNTVNPYWTEGKVDRGNIGNLRFYGGYEEVYP